MTRALTVHQVLHGYEGGHRRLAGSITLLKKDETLITRISDLSGPLLGMSELEPYLTGYPLPSGRFYAFARTWLDKNALRLGSVLTHTILVPSEDFGQIEDIEVLLPLVSMEPNPKNLSPYENHLSLVPQVVQHPERLTEQDEWLLTLFLTKYFGEGHRPILWFDAQGEWSLIRRLFYQLWPQMRQQFGFCTLSLQLRSLEERAFDLLFSSSQRLNKHHQLKQENLIGHPHEASSQSVAPLDSWITDLKTAILTLKSPVIKEDFSELWPDLIPDPTVVPRLYRLSEILSRLNTSPMAVIGAIDLLAPVVPATDAALAYKIRVILDGIENIEVAGNASDKVRALFRVSERIRNPPFVNAESEIFPHLRGGVMKATVLAPDIALGLIESGTNSVSTAYLVGLTMGLVEAAHQNSQVFDLVSPETAFKLALEASYLPILRHYYLHMIKTNRLDIRTSIARTLAEQSSDKILLIRPELLSSAASHDDVTVVATLIDELASDEISGVLTELSEASNGFASTSIRELIQKKISLHYQTPVQNWGASIADWTFGIAAVVSASFRENTLPDLLAYSDGYTWQPLLIIAYYQQVPSELLFSIPTILVEHPAVFFGLLSDIVTRDKEANSLLDKLLRELASRSLPISESLLEKVSAYSDTTVAKALEDAFFKSVLRQFREDNIDSSSYSRWSALFAQSWFATVSPRDLNDIFMDEVGFPSL